MNKSIAVIVPAYNEEILIEKTISSIPDIAEKIIVVNDCSTDKTKEILENLIKVNNKIQLINLKKNSGVGSAIVKGYEIAFEQGFDIGVVMPGDAQALPEDFNNLIQPLMYENYDYSKGNRLNYKGAQRLCQNIDFLVTTVNSSNKICNWLLSYHGSADGLHC